MWIMPSTFWGRAGWYLLTPYSKYPCIHPTTSTKATTELLEQDFAHFSYPHTIVSDDATSFSSEEFQAWCRERGIVHLTGAPYHPATNGASTSLVPRTTQPPMGRPPHWCPVPPSHQWGVHLTGTPYHPATNGASTSLEPRTTQPPMVQTFKQALSKSSLPPPRAALQEFLMQYRRTPLADTYSPSELLNGRQMRTKMDVLLPSPPHIASPHRE